MVKNPLHPNNKTANTKLMIAETGSRWPFSEMGWIEEGFIAQRRFSVFVGLAGWQLLCLCTGEAHAWTPFQKFYRAACQTGVMDKPSAYGTALPPSSENRGVSIEFLITHTTMFGLDA